MNRAPSCICRGVVTCRSMTQGTTEGCGRVEAGRKLGGPELYFDPCSFAPPAPGRLGTLGRNTLIAPSIFSRDFSLQREFLLDATKRLQFRAEIFNLPNHSNFGAVSRSGQNVFSGESGSRTSTTSRQIQFALRLPSQSSSWLLVGSSF